MRGLSEKRSVGDSGNGGRGSRGDDVREGQLDWCDEGERTMRGAAKRDCGGRNAAAVGADAIAVIADSNEAFHIV